MHMYTVRQLCLLRGARRVLLCHFSSFGRLQCAPAQAQTHVAALLLREPLVMAHATAVPQWGALKHPLVRRAVPLKSMENGSRSVALRIDSPIVIRFAIWTEIESLSVESIRIDSRL